MEATKPKVEELDLFLMANLRPKTTGLPMTIWVSERGHARHGPRINKVGLEHGDKLDPYRTASVTVSDTPKAVEGELSPQDLRAVQDYIRLNQATLLAYWEGEIDTAELVARLNALSDK